MDKYSSHRGSGTLAQIICLNKSLREQKPTDTNICIKLIFVCIYLGLLSISICMAELTFKTTFNLNVKVGINVHEPPC